MIVAQVPACHSQERRQGGGEEGETGGVVGMMHVRRRKMALLVAHLRPLALSKMIQRVHIDIDRKSVMTYL